LTTAAESKEAPEKGRILVSILPKDPLIHQVRPVYPKEAKSKRIQGTVKFDVVISKTGVVSELHVVSGNPILVSAAMDAVKQWRYAPTLLNGEAVDVKTTIDINFTLNQ
jgi:protein TonB